MSIRVCLVATNAYPSVDPSAGRAVGGLENSAWLIARGLARYNDVDVQFVVEHTRPVPTDRVDRVAIVALVDRWRDVKRRVADCIERSGTPPSIRLRRLGAGLVWRLPLLVATRPFRDRRTTSERLEVKLKSLRPDVIIAFGVGAEPAAVVRAARAIGVPSMAWLQSNANLDERFFDERSAAGDEYVGPYGERRADVREAIHGATSILCQTEEQRRMLRELTGRDSVRIPNALDFAEWDAGSRPPLDGDCVLWIGRYDRFHKRPELCLALARACPDVPFTMVVNAGDADVEAVVRHDAPSNVTLVDYVPRDEMPAWFRRARIFLSTGSAQYEGFPNVLLQAAASGTPIVSLEEFDGFLASSRAGWCAEEDIGRAAELIRKLWSDPTAWQACSEAGPPFVRERHSVDAVARELRRVIDGAIAEHRP